jgi:hypothetical protein
MLRIRFLFEYFIPVLRAGRKLAGNTKFIFLQHTTDNPQLTSRIFAKKIEITKVAKYKHQHVCYPK